MNIFYLDKNPRLCAQYHCDKHIVKMILEYAQLLSTAIHVLDSEMGQYLPIYKKTHENHPCAVWVRHSEHTFMHLVTLAEDCLIEYTRRYKKYHKTGDVIHRLEIPKFNNVGWIDPPQCMPDEYKCSDTVQAYRNYYIGDKSRFAVWKYTEKPEWFNVPSNH